MMLCVKNTDSFYYSNIDVMDVALLVFCLCLAAFLLAWTACYITARYI